MPDLNDVLRNQVDLDGVRSGSLFNQENIARSLQETTCRDSIERERERPRDRESGDCSLLQMELESGKPRTPADEVSAHLDTSRVHLQSLPTMTEYSA